MTEQPRVVTGSPTPEELAAVTAVLAALEAEAAAAPPAELAVGTASAWSRSQHGLRRPLVRGAGAWRSFSA